MGWTIKRRLRREGSKGDRSKRGGVCRVERGRSIEGTGGGKKRERREEVGEGDEKREEREEEKEGEGTGSYFREDVGGSTT